MVSVSCSCLSKGECIPKPAPNILTIQVAERLPPPPQPSKFSQRKLPSSFSPREFDFQAPVPSSPSPHVDSYLVYVNDNTSLTLQEVQQLEPTAYVRQYKGRSVIQAGVFNKEIMLSSEQRN